MKTASKTVKIDADKDYIWDCLTNIENWSGLYGRGHEINTRLVDSMGKEVEGNNLKSGYTIKASLDRGGYSWEEDIIDLVPKSSLCFESTAAGGKISWRYTLKEIGEMTEVTVQMDMWDSIGQDNLQYLTDEWAIEMKHGVEAKINGKGD